MAEEEGFEKLDAKLILNVLTPNPKVVKSKVSTVCPT
jgi:hypothetical protein